MMTFVCNHVLEGEEIAQVSIDPPDLEVPLPENCSVLCAACYARSDELGVEDLKVIHGGHLARQLGDFVGRVLNG